ncbi:MAG: hypothetical protein ACFCVH_03660 [Alphaproteobacteria bacterium]
MGEARRKKEGRTSFLARHPCCCYCGGATPATTLDHVPSRQMFALRRRPKGLEVPACEACNRATRHHEQVAAMLGRFYPDSDDAAEQHEMRRIMEAVSRNVPGLLEGMQPSAGQQLRFIRSGVRPPGLGGALNCNGPLLNEAIQKFGAKLGFALHYHLTGRIVPRAGGVAVRWYTNYDAMTRGIPSSLFRILGEPETLRQGRWSVSDQFAYAYAIKTGSSTGAYFSTFRRSFAVLSWVCEDRARLGDAAESRKPLAGRRGAGTRPSRPTHTPLASAGGDPKHAVLPLPSRPCGPRQPRIPPSAAAFSHR